MDVGMYGHGQHNNYGSSESSYFNYSNDSCQGNHPYQSQSSHFSSSTYHYDEPSYIYATSEAADTPPSPQDLNYFHHHQNVHQENPIISTDTGLSYTNLDYGNSTSPHVAPGIYPSLNHQSNYQSDSYQRTHPEMILRHHEEVTENHPVHHNYLHENKYLPHQLEGEAYSHPHLVPPNTSTSCMEYQHHPRFKEESLQNADMERHHHQPHHVIHNMSSVPQPQPVIPTYKWMQVKRNVPKPNGKFLENYSVEC